MFASLRAKIVLLMTLTLAATAGLVLFFSQRDVERAMAQAEARSAENVLNILDLALNNIFGNMLYEKNQAVLGRKRALRDASSLAMAGLRQFSAAAGRQGVGGLSEQAAKEAALAWIKTLRFGDSNSFLVFDKDYHALASADPDLQGKDLSAFQDMKNRSVVKAMYADAKKFGSEFDVFYWKRPASETLVQRIGHFAYFAPWDWVLAACDDIEFIKAEERLRRENALKVMQDALTKVKIADSGFVFLFTSEGRILNPSKRIEAADLSAAQHNLVAELAAAAGQGRGRLLKTLPLSGNVDRPMEFRVSFFKPFGLYVATAAFVEEIHAPARALASQLTMVIAAVFLAGGPLALLFVHRISSPLKRLSLHARGLAARDFTAPQGLSPINDLAQKPRGEVGLLARSLVFMEDELRRNIQTLVAANAAKERLENELHVARRIQMDMLPEPLPPSAFSGALDIDALLVPAKEVGGDLYNYFFLDDKHLCLCIGDVSGKGVPASLFMAVTTTLITSRADVRLTPGAILGMVNNDLHHGNTANMFVTLFLGILHIPSGVVRYACGGHNPSLLARKGGDTHFLPLTEDPMLGLLPDIAFKTERVALNPGDLLFSYSDGVTEAMNPAGRFLTEERLKAMVERFGDRKPNILNELILRGVRLFSDGAEQSDDITMLTLRYRG